MWQGQLVFSRFDQVATHTVIGHWVVRHDRQGVLEENRAVPPIADLDACQDDAGGQDEDSGKRQGHPPEPASQLNIEP